MRPQIAKAHGVEWSMFGSDTEASQAIDEIISYNRELYGDKIDSSLDWHSVMKPQILSEFAYVHVTGTIITCVLI